MQRWGWEKCFPGSLTLPDRIARRACLGFYPEVSWMVYTAHPPRRQVGLSCSRPGPLFTLRGLNCIPGSFCQRPQSSYFSFFTEVVSELKKFKPRTLTLTERKLETSPVPSLRIFHSPRATKLGITFLVLRDEVTAKQGRQKKGKRKHLVLGSHFPLILELGSHLAGKGKRQPWACPFVWRNAF